jgi:hypothetical protein
MGRGRQKAKHTKVARELKYFSPNTNYGALERELTHASGSEPEYIDRWGDDEPDGAGITHESEAFGGVASSGLSSPDYGVDEYEDYDGDESAEPHSKTA